MLRGADDLNRKAVNRGDGQDDMGDEEILGARRTTGKTNDREAEDWNRKEVISETKDRTDERDDWVN